ncbi:hypothetical protein K1T71_007923 [Dendrolimus kikuchii]|uniref:Uncharacterized protein n=1 Tax=Dendrolimus kikuchii TaxID=765133 RepID=A0ACC1CYE0_9NEOP|nr:hypothetical protein K1T71_007923 [Dendrolimus kikuchii]
MAFSIIGKSKISPISKPLSEASSLRDLAQNPETIPSEPYVTQRKKKNLEDPRESTPLAMQDMLKNVQQMVKDLKASQDQQFTQIKEDINSLRRQNDELLTSNTEIKNSVSKIILEQNVLKTRVETLEKNITFSVDYVHSLEQQVEQLDWKLRETSIEIQNLPTDNNSQMHSLLKKLHSVLNVAFTENEVRNAYRLPAKSNNPRPIILEYVSVVKKQEMLQAYKKFNSTHKDNRLNLSALGFHEENSVIYINELLTKKGKNLHYLARKLIKGIDWKFCWTSRGKIFIRKEEGQPAIEIKSDEQISTLNKNSTVE